MTRGWIVLIILVLVSAGFGLGTPRLGKLGYMTTKKQAVVVVPPCPSPTAPNGVFDLSQCSNAFYVVILPL